MWGAGPLFHKLGSCEVPFLGLALSFEQPHSWGALRVPRNSSNSCFSDSMVSQSEQPREFSIRAPADPSRPFPPRPPAAGGCFIQ